MLYRKHFVALAAILLKYHPKNQDSPFDIVPYQLILDIADYLQTLNPAFDRKRFIKATEGRK